MNNIELQNKIEEIVSIENFFDMIEAVVDFEGEYKKTSFYKKTKMSLTDVVKDYKILHSISLDGLMNNVQKMIDGLDVNKFLIVLNQLGDIFAEENNNIREQAKNLQESFSSLIEK